MLKQIGFMFSYNVFWLFLPAPILARAFLKNVPDPRFIK